MTYFDFVFLQKARGSQCFRNSKTDSCNIKTPPFLSLSLTHYYPPKSHPPTPSSPQVLLYDLEYCDRSPTLILKGAPGDDGLLSAVQRSIRDVRRYLSSFFMS